MIVTVHHYLELRFLLDCFSAPTLLRLSDNIDHTKNKPINVLRYEVFFNQLSVPVQRSKSHTKCGNQFW